MEASMKIRPEEFADRTERLRRYLAAEELEGAVLFDNYYIQYFTGFAFIPTERPIAFLLNARGDTALFVPRLELEHAQTETGFERVETYTEYPHQRHPSEALHATMSALGMASAVGADTDGYPWIFGYRGPALSEVMGVPVRPVTGYVEDLMAIKSPAEIALIRESCTWGNLAHRLLQRYTHVGATETEVSMRASHEATLAMMDALGHRYAAQSTYGEGAGAGYRGQIGRNAAIPHALASNITFMDGDVLVTGAGAPLWGYNSELERTLILGRPTGEQRRMFDHMVALQDTALAAMRPGVECAVVDAEVRAYFEAHDLLPYWKHHSGHAIGLRYHEGPFLDVGDRTVLRPGMVFTVEPGLYAPELGGFRHSDTVLITEDEIEMLTYYPRDLESLTIAS